MDQIVGASASEDAGAGIAVRIFALREVETFGTNPGNLRMVVAAPAGSARSRCPLVVVLHGGSQTAASYDAGSGWSRLAAAHDFVVVYAEQRRANNDQTCFSWFRPTDIARSGGEAESVRQMVAKATTDFGIDVRRVYVVGLSAGGAMAGAMLAAYPEVFAGGGVIAGLPYGAATGVIEAFEAMYCGRVKHGRVWGGLVRAASGGYAGAWPSVAIWQGTADHVVRPVNAGELVKQWLNVHGLDAVVPTKDEIGPATRLVWNDASGRACVTQYTLPGLGHGVPIDKGEPPAPFFLPAGISSTEQIAKDFGLTRPRVPLKRTPSAVEPAG